MYAIAAVTVPLVLLAAAANVPESMEGEDPARELFEGAPDHPPRIEVGDEMYDAALKQRIKRHVNMIHETGGDGAFNNGILRTGIRTKLNQLRSQDGRNKPALDVMQYAGAVAQQVAEERRYRQMIFPGRIAKPATDVGRTRPLALTYLGVPSISEPTPFVRQVSNPARPSVEYPSNDPVDRNRTAWLINPFSVGNPLMAFNKTRAPPTNVAPNSAQLAPITTEEVANLLPRTTSGTRRGSRFSRGRGRGVHFSPS